MSEDKQKKDLLFGDEKAEETTPKAEEPAPAPAPPTDQVAQLMEMVKKQSEEINMLKDMAGHNAIASYNEGKKDHTKKQVYLKKYNDKIVVGWGKLDQSKRNSKAKNADEEMMKMEVTYLDETETEVIPYMEFIRCSDFVYAELIKFDPNVDGNSTIKFNETGRELKIKTKFLNA